MTWIHVWLLCGAVGTAMHFIAWYMDESSEGMKATFDEECRTSSGVEFIVVYMVLSIVFRTIIGPISILVSAPAFVKMAKKRRKQ
jgi:hypothetical protein